MNLWVVFGIFILTWVAAPSLTDEQWGNVRPGSRLAAMIVLCGAPALLLGRGFA